MELTCSTLNPILLATGRETPRGANASAVERTTAELAQRAAGGSIEAFEELAIEFEPRIYGFLYRYVGNAHDAQDLTQETFVRAWRAIRRFDPARDFATWLFVIARRAAANHFRARRVYDELTDDFAAESAKSNDEAEGLDRGEKIEAKLLRSVVVALWRRVFGSANGRSHGPQHDPRKSNPASRAQRTGAPHQTNRFMIFCFLHQPALRRHLDDSEPLSAPAKAHLEKCPRCRELVAAHLAIIKNLSRRRNNASETPAFLHARVMNSVQGAPPTANHGLLRWIGIAAAFAAITIAVFLVLPKQAPQRAATLPTLPRAIAFTSSFPPNPLETEIENLRADTLNAARALAANFWPETGSQK